jgi:pimeloyl-ACP methyl ester carboxylesterase
MAKTKRLFKSFSRLLLPVVVLVVLAILSASVWLVHMVSRPASAGYLVTPEKYGLLSARGATITDENWTNRDGTEARGWLLRGAENSPAVILFHRYGADRSHVLDLGVKLNEATNFTVLMPDLRGHGVAPKVNYTAFGEHEIEDVLAAVEFLRGLKTEAQTPLVGENIGFYGVEMGAFAALSAAAKDEKIKSLALDSVPENSDGVIYSAVNSRYPFASSFTSKLAKAGSYFYFIRGSYSRNSSCETAKNLNNRQVLLLAGADAPQFQESTSEIAKCVPHTSKIEARTDLNPSGFSVVNTSLEQSENYERKIIEFFKLSLGN